MEILNSIQLTDLMSLILSVKHIAIGLFVLVSISYIVMIVTMTTLNNKVKRLNLKLKSIVGAIGTDLDDLSTSISNMEIKLVNQITDTNVNTSSEVSAIKMATNDFKLKIEQLNALEDRLAKSVGATITDSNALRARKANAEALLNEILKANTELNEEIAKFEEVKERDIAKLKAMYDEVLKLRSIETGDKVKIISDVDGVELGSIHTISKVMELLGIARVAIKHSTTGEIVLVKLDAIELYDETQDEAQSNHEANVAMKEDEAETKAKDLEEQKEAKAETSTGNYEPKAQAPVKVKAKGKARKPKK